MAKKTTSPKMEIRDKAQANLRRMVSDESNRLGKVRDVPFFFQDQDDLEEASAARWGDNLGQRTRELKSIARGQNEDIEQKARNKAARDTIPKKRQR